METGPSAPLKKRARTSDAYEVLSKDNEFWYDDGTILLIAENVEFRVYRGPLVKHSPFFRDLVSLPQAPSQQHSRIEPCQIQECPVVHLTDSPQDLRHLLRVFTAGDSPEPFGASTPSFHALSSCIRLGHKYQINGILEDGLRYLRQFYPSSLSRDLLFPGNAFSTRYLIAKSRPPSVTGRRAIAVVNIARLTEKYDLLPLALLECCKLGRDIVQGYTHEDGSVENLSLEDLGRCFKVKAQLVLRNVEASRNILRRDLAGMMCESGGRCERVMKLRRQTNVYLRFSQVDDILTDSTVAWHMSPSLCDFCQASVSFHLRSEQRKFWNELPALLDVAVPDGWQIRNCHG